MNKAWWIVLAMGLATSAMGQPSDCAARHDAEMVQEAKDTALLNTIVDEERTRGLPALNAHLDELLAMVERAPPVLITECNATIYMRPSGGAAELAKALLLAAAETKGGSVKTIMLGPSPYVIAAGRAGATYMARRDWAKADAVMQMGLRLNPAEPWMASQEMLVLALLKRPEESLRLGDGVLADQPKIDGQAHGAILRSRGATLVSMKRLDEARTAYQASLQFDPNNDEAKAELAVLNSSSVGASPP